VSDSALLAVAVAAVAGLLAGRAWNRALRRSGRGAGAFRASPHYTQGLNYLAAGQADLALSELTKVAREDLDAVEVQQVQSHLLREAGQVERAIQVHQALLARHDLTRAERAFALAGLGTDFRKAGFLDRATRVYQEALDLDPNNLQGLDGQQRLFEEQGLWREAYEVRTHLARLRKSDDGVVLGHLQAQQGRMAAAAGNREAAEACFKTALSLNRQVFPAHLGLADLYLDEAPVRAAAILEDAVRLAPDRAYLAFDRLLRAYAAFGEPTRFEVLCEKLIHERPLDWRARVSLARHLRSTGRHEEALGLLLRALEANPQVLIVHLEAWRTLRALHPLSEPAERYIATAEEAVFYRDPHICTQCRYRADDMLWRCPHCHEWDTFVEERVSPAPEGR
jgi:lipopolysaccharide biosynthesis regulator YciM